MPEVPAVATVVAVATVIPVVAVEVFWVDVSAQIGFAPAVPVSELYRVKVWLWPGSVTVDVLVAVCVWLTTDASAEPPVPSTA